MADTGIFFIAFSRSRRGGEEKRAERQRRYSGAGAQHSAERRPVPAVAIGERFLTGYAVGHRLLHSPRIRRRALGDSAESGNRTRIVDIRFLCDQAPAADDLVVGQGEPPGFRRTRGDPDFRRAAQFQPVGRRDRRADGAGRFVEPRQTRRPGRPRTAAPKNAVGLFPDRLDVAGRGECAVGQIPDRPLRPAGHTGLHLLLPVADDDRDRAADVVSETKTNHAVAVAVDDLSDRIPAYCAKFLK